MLLMVLKIFRGLIVSRISPFSFCVCQSPTLVEMLTHRNVFTLWLLLHFHGTGSVAKFTFVSESSNAYHSCETEEIHYMRLG